MAPTLRRASSQLLKLLSRAANPLPLAGEIRAYARTFGGPTEWEMIDGTGNPYQFTGPNAQNLPKGYVDGCQLTWVSATRLTIEAGYCRSDDDTFDLYLQAAVTVNLAVVGANGIDAGAQAANTWYAFYIIGDSTYTNAEAGIASTNFTAPTLPAGYDKYRRVGAIRSATTTNLVRFFQRPLNGDQRTRRVYQDALFGPLITALTATAFTDLDLSGQLPPSSGGGILEIRFQNGTLGALADNVEIRPKGANSADGPTAWRRAVNLAANLAIAPMEFICDKSTQFIQYKVTQGGASQNQAQMRCIAYDDEI